VTAAKPLKVMTIVGTRPEIIRLSEVMRRLDESPVFEHCLVHTGQNYDYELNQVFFEDLGLRRPDRFLDAAGETFGRTYGNILALSETAMREERPDAVLILGDTNSALSAIIAKRLHIPIFHMEAGNRCFDFNVPEETNRRIVDHTADFNLVYTEHARRHLISEGLPHRRIYLTGSPMREVLNRHVASIEASDVLDRLELQAEAYMIASIHREENVDQPGNLASIVDALNRLAERYEMPIVVSTHPRTRKRLETMTGVVPGSRLRFLKPFGFHDYIKLQQAAYCALSDSGTISEESAILGFPAVTIRSSMERPEALDTGSILMTGLDVENIARAVELSVSCRNGERPSCPADYDVADVSLRVTRLILSTAGLSNKWHGIQS
jgi:UDP-N-acetylglucosamine 2-epimerase (non-hydrolysing)